MEFKANTHARAVGVANLERVEREIDEAASVATPALHAFVRQHHEDHLVDSQKGNQDQRRPDQTGGHKQNPQCCTVTASRRTSDKGAERKALSSFFFFPDLISFFDDI